MVAKRTRKQPPLVREEKRVNKKVWKELLISEENRRENWCIERLFDKYCNNEVLLGD